MQTPPSPRKSNSLSTGQCTPIRESPDATQESSDSGLQSPRAFVDIPVQAPEISANFDKLVRAIDPGGDRSPIRFISRQVKRKKGSGEGKSDTPAQHVRRKDDPYKRMLESRQIELVRRASSGPDRIAPPSLSQESPIRTSIQSPASNRRPRVTPLLGLQALSRRGGLIHFTAPRLNSSRLDTPRVNSPRLNSPRLANSASETPRFQVPALSPVKASTPRSEWRSSLASPRESGKTVRYQIEEESPARLSPAARTPEAPREAGHRGQVRLARSAGDVRTNQLLRPTSFSKAEAIASKPSPRFDSPGPLDRLKKSMGGLLKSHPGKFGKIAESPPKRTERPVAPGRLKRALSLDARPGAGNVPAGPRSRSHGGTNAPVVKRLVNPATQDFHDFGSPAAFDRRLAATLASEMKPMADATSAASARNAAFQLFRCTSNPGQRFLGDVRKTRDVATAASEFIDRIDGLPSLQPEALARFDEPGDGLLSPKEFAQGIDLDGMVNSLIPALDGVIGAIADLRLPPALKATVNGMVDAIHRTCAESREANRHAVGGFKGIDAASEREFVQVAAKAAIFLGFIAPELTKWSLRELGSTDQRKHVLSRVIGYIVMKLGTGSALEQDYFPKESQARFGSQWRRLASAMPGIVDNLMGWSRPSSPKSAAPEKASVEKPWNRDSAESENSSEHSGATGEERDPSTSDELV